MWQDDFHEITAPQIHIHMCVSYNEKKLVLISHHLIKFISFCVAPCASCSLKYCIQMHRRAYSAQMLRFMSFILIHFQFELCTAKAIFKTNIEILNSCVWIPRTPRLRLHAHDACAKIYNEQNVSINLRPQWNFGSIRFFSDFIAPFAMYLIALAIHRTNSLNRNTIISSKLSAIVVFLQLTLERSFFAAFSGLALLFVWIDVVHRVQYSHSKRRRGREDKMICLWLLHLTHLEFKWYGDGNISTVCSRLSLHLIYSSSLSFWRITRSHSLSLPENLTAACYPLFAAEHVCSLLLCPIAQQCNRKLNLFSIKCKWEMNRKSKWTNYSVSCLLVIFIWLAIYCCF